MQQTIYAIGHCAEPYMGHGLPTTTYDEAVIHRWAPELIRRLAARNVVGKDRIRVGG